MVRVILVIICHFDHWLLSMQELRRWDAVRIFQFLEIFASISDVDERCLWWHRRVWHDDHYVCVAGECIDECSELAVSYLHRLKFRAELWARQLKLFYDIRYFLEAVKISVLLALWVRNDQEGRALKEKHFIRVNYVRKVGKRMFQSFYIRDQHVDLNGVERKDILLLNGWILH